VHSLSGKRRHKELVKVIARRTVRESAALDLLVLSLDSGNAHAGEGLFTRNPNPLQKGKGTGRQLKFRAQRVCAAVKGASARLDLPPELFSSHSWCKAGLKQLGGNGASCKLMAARGSWKEDSVTMSSVYDEAHTAIIGLPGCLLRRPVWGPKRPAMASAA
jgi:hypothetical protein